MGSVSQATGSQDFSVQQEDVAVTVTMSLPSPPRPPSRYADIEDKQMKSPDIPPPPPPPPPPLLPLPPELGHPAGGLKKKRRVRSFFWKTIPEEQVEFLLYICLGTLF